MPNAPAPATFRAELGATLGLAGPLVLANLLQMAVYAIDVIFVARLGAVPLAAASLSTSLFGLLVWSGSGLIGAAIALIAAELGRGVHGVREVRRTMRMALWLAVLAGLAGMAICAAGEGIMLATGQQPQVASQAGGFLALLAWSLIPQIACTVLRGFVAALGRPIFATLITALAIAINALGNYALVFGNLGAPALGLEGSAISTIVTSFATLFAYLAAIRSDRRMRRYRILGRWWRPDWQRLGEITRLGLPIALIVFAEGGFFGSAAFLMGLLGPAQIAAHTVALQVAAFAFQVPFGVAQAVTIRVGFGFGANDRAAAGRAGWAGLVVCFLFAACAASVMLLFPRAILSIYVDVDAPANAAMLAFAMQYLLVAAAFQLFDGTQAVAAGALRGLQDTRMPMMLALLGYWGVGFGLATGLGFATPLGGLGVWFGLAMGLVVVAALLLWRWYRRERLGLI